MKRVKVEKTVEQIKIERLINAHGKLYSELAENECIIMRLEGQLEVAQRRGDAPDRIKPRVINALLMKCGEIRTSMETTVKAIERLTGTQAPEFAVPVHEERDVTPIQQCFLLT